MKYNKICLLSCLITGSISTSCISKDFVALSGIHSEHFHKKINGEKIHLYRITNTNGLEACITNYGARIVSLMVPSRNGIAEDIVCGFPDISGYTNQPQNYGATVGRYIGRILNAQYTLDNETHHLQANHIDGHTAHGGDPNFGARVWRVKQNSPSSVTMTYVSPDGENGFPGNLNVELTYTLTEENALDIRYRATTDKPTVINLCNHSFFNISGNLTSSIENQVLWVDANYFTPYDKKKCVTGELWPVEDTPLNFTEAQTIGKQINNEYGQLRIVNGYDHAWALNNPGNDNHPSAWIYDKESGRKMEVYTTEPAIHIYTGNGLKGNVKGKNGISYPFRGAICFETCHFQDSPNNPQFPSTVLRPGETFESHTAYRFVIIK